MRLNLNDSIRVKLTDLGKDIYYHRYDRLNNALGRQICKPSMPKVDEDGYTTFQLWCFMELYGVHMGMILPNVIEPLDIVFDAPTIEPEQRWIPVSERLPNTNGIYIVTRRISDGFKCRNITDACYFDGSNTWHDDTRVNHKRKYLADVLAWMPRPEPYREEGRDD